MKSENKWSENMKQEKLERKNNNLYREDDTIDKNDNPLYMLLKASALIAGGTMAYKRGFFKKPLQNIIKYAGQFGESDFNISTTVKTFNKWANSTALDNSYNNSIFRNGLKFDSIKSSVKDGNISKIIKDTSNDVNELFKRNKAAIKNFKDNRAINSRFYYESELISNLTEINKISSQYKKYENGSAMSRKAKEMMTKDLAKNLGIDEEIAKNQIKRTGHRNLTLGDIYDTVRDKKTGKISLINKNTNFMFDESSTSLIEDFLRTTTTVYKDKNGKSMVGTLINSDNWKSFRVDNGIFIDELGNISDLRYASRNTSEFIRTLANDYQIPLLSFNPLRFFGLDKFGIKKNRYGIIHQTTIQNVLTGLPGRVTLEETGKFGKNPLLFVNDSVYQFSGDKVTTATKIASNMKVDKMSKKTGSYGIRSDFNSLRKMANINTKEYKLYGDEDGSVKSFYSQLMRKLDLGFQDRDINYYKKVVRTNTGSKEVYTNTNSGLFNTEDFIENIKSSVLNKIPKPYKDVSESIGINQVFGTVRKDEDIYVLRHKDTSLRDVFDKDKKDTITKYFKETFAGRDNLQDVGDRALTVYSVFDRLNQTLSNVGVGLGTESIGSAKDILVNLTTKRFLLVYGLYQTMQYVTYLTEKRNEGKQENVNIQTRVADVFKAIDLNFHRIKDFTGITSIAKGVTDLLPGIDQVTELPGISSLALDKTYEERKEYYESGMTPIRKGRYWDLGNTPFTGGKIQYYKANLYRRIKGDVMYSDSKYGSREEYFENAWFPTPTNPLAPIKHFITDKYHYDIKHYYDRPYPITSQEFKNVPIIGDLLAPTIGQAIKPTKRMHNEIWNSITPTQDKTFETIFDENKENEVTVNLINSNTKSEEMKDLGNQVIFYNNDREGINRLSNKVVFANVNNAFENVENNEFNAIGKIPNVKENNIPIVYTTSSGINNIYQASGEEYLSSLKRNLPYTTPEVATGIRRLELDKNQKEANISNVYMPNDLKLALASQYSNMTNLTGMTGYVTESFMTGTPMDNTNVLDEGSYAYGFGKTFWDQEYGGIGGALSEIFRRFIPEKNKDYNYINPIKNTMPDWMPGEEYFIDFLHGDPYTKVKWGEGRLPGEGYERLWGIEPFKLGIGSSFIGKSKEDLRKHFLFQDAVEDQWMQDILDKGTKVHEQIEKELLASGDAKNIEQTFVDEVHNVQGTYDVLLAKDNELTGKEGIMDVKTVSAKKLEEIRRTKIPKPENVSQVNFYLHNLGYKEGSILYVNRDNTDDREVITFNYNKKLYEEDMQRVEEVRQEILEDVRNGTLKRGDLYSPIDRVRILADVAPYSKEYKEAVELLKNKGMSEEKEKELREIEERVKKQKEPLRVYDYKFSTANLEEKKVVIDKVISKDVFTVKGEDNVSYKLGGIEYKKLETSSQDKALKSFLSETIKEGNVVTIQTDPNETQSNPTGINRTVKAIVKDGSTNLNKELVKQGYADTKDSNDPLSVNVKYSKFSKLFGSVWEKFAHMDTYFHTKFLQVRSPLEHYKRNVVYGEDFQEWERPVENFLMPVINKSIERPLGLLFAGIIGASFGRTKAAKIIGAGLGIGVVGTGKVIKKAKEISTGEKWKPERRKKEEEVEEYIDKLKYVKNMKLYEEYSKKALEEDGFDVKEYQREDELAASYRKSKANKVKRKKRELNYGKITEKEYLDIFETSELTKEQRKALAKKKKDKDKEIDKELREKIIDTSLSNKTIGEKFKKGIELGKRAKEKHREVEENIEKAIVTQRKGNINKDNNKNTQFRKITQLPENAILALQYYQKAQETVYGYDYGENIQNLMKALPKTEKDFFKYFTKAPEEEKEEILEVIPNYLKEPMMNLWGKHIDTPKESLEDYFSKHQLPEEDWIGWDEDISLDSVKVKLVEKEGLEYSNFNIWQDDLDLANSVNIPIPYMDKKVDKNKAKSLLERLLLENGYENVEVTPSKSLSNNIVLNIKNDTRYEVEKKLNDENYLLE